MNTTRLCHFLSNHSRDGDLCVASWIRFLTRKDSDSVIRTSLAEAGRCGETLSSLPLGNLKRANASNLGDRFIHLSSTKS